MKRADVFTAFASLAVAVLLWLQIQPIFEPGREREFAAPLLLENRPANVVAVPTTDSVIVVASGSLAALDNLDTSAVRARIDLTNAKPGLRKFFIEVTGPTLGEVEIRPKSARVEVAIERLVSVEMPVDVVTTDAPPGDVTYSGAAIQPASVKVLGPEGRIKAVVRAKVTLDLRKLKPGATYSLPVEVLDQAGQPVPLMRTEPAEVTVSPSVQIADATRVVPVNIDWTGQLPFRRSVTDFTVSPPTVTITGPSEDVAKVTSVSSKPVALESIVSGRPIMVSLNVPRGLRAGTGSVTVIVRLKKGG